MVNKVDKDLGVFISVKNGAGSCGRVTLEHGKEVLRSNISTRVSNDTSIINVVTVWLVEELSGERVVSAAGNVVIHHQDDVLSGDTVSDHKLVGVGSVGLMPVVVVASGASNDNSGVGHNVGSGSAGGQ